MFFSSRRRHTRLQGDWSSDVCSSDLFIQRRRGLREKRGGTQERKAEQHEDSTVQMQHHWRNRVCETPVTLKREPPTPRSEERRVGKESTSRRERANTHNIEQEVRRRV